MYNLFMRISSALFFLFLGGTVVAAAFFAEQIGLDNDAGWGRGRIVLLLTGVLFFAIGILEHFFTHGSLSTSVLRKIRGWMTQSIAGVQKFTQVYWYTFPAVFIVILVYVWFASSGSWSQWKPATDYYADLADGFQRGHLYVQSRPSPELRSLTNPYDPLLRQGIEFPIDYSLFNGKFYLYWGPVPALLVLLVEPFSPWKVADLFLAFGFTSGIFLLQYSLLILIWDRFFHSSPKWLLVLSIVAAGLNGPWTYMLVNEPNGRIYEASIAGAQFFLLAGLVVAIRALVSSRISYFSLIMVSLLLGLAIGTRLVIAVPVGFVCMMSVYQIWRRTKPSLKEFILKSMALGMPLAVCLIAIGWYNWARFGSITDTGMAYALAHQDMSLYQDELFSPVYIVQNFYNYILNEPISLAQFPFFNAKGRVENVVPFLYSLPEVYQSQPVAGLLYMAPFTIFAAAPIVLSFKKPSPATPEDGRFAFYTFINVILFGAFFSAFCCLLLFFWSALRYAADFMPALLMAATMGFWRGHQLLARRPLAQNLYSMLGIILAAIGTVTSISIALSANQYN